MKLWKKIIGRFLSGIGVLWGAVTLTFLVLNLTGGDMAVAILGGPDAIPTPQALEYVRAEYGLDKPLWEQYGIYLGKYLTGDLGESYRLKIPVTKAIAQQVLPTLQLASCAAFFALTTSILLALFTAHRSSWLRKISSNFELTIASIPSFVSGILLLLLFSFEFKLFPAAGNHGWKSLVLPVIALSLSIIAQLTQVLRRELEEILEQPFILTARARGMSDAGVRWGHALRHALIPVVTLSGYLFANLLGGSVITETLFSRPGIGRLLVDSTAFKDVPLVLGIILLSAAVYVVINFIVDLAYPLIDPRLASKG